MRALVSLDAHQAVICAAMEVISSNFGLTTPRTAHQAITRIDMRPMHRLRTGGVTRSPTAALRGSEMHGVSARSPKAHRRAARPRQQPRLSVGDRWSGYVWLVAAPTRSCM